MPTPYVGLSIYFRPIDKNTRRNSFARKRTGHDDGIASHYSVRQHLSLNLGFTLASVPRDFDNFYSGHSLMIGPSYRFARAFKFSVGAAFFKRSSSNPVISEKKVVGGFYAALSVDVDFVQGVKDITKLVFGL